MIENERKFWWNVFCVVLIVFYLLIVAPMEQQYKMNLTIRAIQTHEASRDK